MTAALSIQDLVKTYDDKVQALKGVSLEVKEGDFFALLGPNGAGKSTLINILVSLVKKTSGSVSIMGYDIDQQFDMAKSCIGIVPQEFNFHIFATPWHIVLNQAGYYGIPSKIAKQRAQQYLTQLGLWEKRNSPALTLSGGMKRRLMIARALVHEPKMLVLDEPTAGVDIEIRRSMWDFLTKLNECGTTVILTTHYLEEAEQLCRNIAIINKGNIVANTSMPALLQQLEHERFILNLKQPYTSLVGLEGFKVLSLDSQTLEVEVSKHTGMNELFSKLNDLGICVTSMRNKSNRLEELFIDLTRNG